MQLSMYASNIINSLCEDLRLKLKLYSNSYRDESLKYYFEKERYIKIAEIIINRDNKNIKKMIDELPYYYQNGIKYKDAKFDIRNDVSYVCSQIYKQLYNIDEKKAFHSYLDIVQNKLHGDLNWFFDLDFNFEPIKEHFLNNATKYIIKNQNKNWIDEFQKIDYNRYSWLKYIDIKEIPRKFNTKEELFFWLKDNEQEEILDFLGLPILNSLLDIIIRHEAYNVHSHYLKKNRIIEILEECSNDYILVGRILTEKDIGLNIFFLHFFEYFLFGFLNLYELDSAPHNLQSKNMNYTQNWNKMIAKQMVDIIFLQFSSLQNKNDFSTRIFHILNYMARNYVLIFDKNYENNTKRKNLFKYFLEELPIYEIKIGHHKKNFLIEYCINDLVDKQINSLNNIQLDLSNYYLLSFYLEQLKQIEKLFDKNNSNLIMKITDAILTNLMILFQNNLQDDRLYIKVEFLETIDFSLFYKFTENKEKWLNLIDIGQVKDRWSQLKEEKSKRNSLTGKDPIEPKNIVKLYFYILIQIYKDNQAQDISKKLNILAIEFGLNIDFGIFYEMSWMGHQFTENLFVKYIQLLNTFTENLFETFAEELYKKEKLRDMLELLNFTEAEDRKIKISDKINLYIKNSNLSFNSYFDIRESISYAQTNGFNELSEQLIKTYEEKIEKTSNYNKKNDFLETVCRKRILDIFYNDNLDLDEKFIELNQYKNPFDDRNHGIESKQIKCENYQDFIRAILFFETEPIKTYQILSELIEKEINSLYLINMINAYFRAYENDENKKIKFEYILGKYKEYNKKLIRGDVTLYECQVLFYGYLITEDESKFIQLWLKMPKEYQYDIQIVELRCEFLQKNNQSLKAKEYIYEVKEKLNLTSEESRKIEQIEQKVTNNIIIEVENKLKVKIDFKSLNLSVRDAKNYWLQIKDMTDDEHAQIFSKNNNLSEFIKDIMLNISKELLNRKVNIQKQTEQKIEIENIINDWVKSLIEQRMSFLNWHTKDQTRGGKSSSEKSVGEKDLEVYNAQNEKLFLFEAFRLFGENKTTIKDHINKLDGYNADGCQILIVMSYTKVQDFQKLYNNYKKLLMSFDYKGFDKPNSPKSDNHEEINAKSSNIKILKEIKFKNNTPITLYHFLLDFQ